MKKWNAPVVEEMELKATAYVPDGTDVVDGTYTSKDGKINIDTHGGTGDLGQPIVIVTPKDWYLYSCIQKDRCSCDGLFGC